MSQESEFVFIDMKLLIVIFISLEELVLFLLVNGI